MTLPTRQCGPRWARRCAIAAAYPCLADHTRPSRRPRLAAGLLPALALALSQPACTTLSTNFHAVEEGRFYRSAQVGAGTLARLIRKHGLRTVVNLRGKKDQAWYAQEKALCAKLGVEHIDLDRFRSSPRKDRLLKLLEVLEGEEYPVYVHCAGGKDRAGMASAFYLAYRGKPVDEALAELTRWKYRNWPWQDRRKQREFFALYERFSREHGPTPFRDWFVRHYTDALLKARLAGKARSSR